MEKFESFEQRVNLYEKEIERIRSILKKYLPEKEAVETAAEIYEMILDIDEGIDELLKDPEVLKKYTYDGNLFIPKDKPNFFHKAANGLKILKSIDENILDSFGHDKISASKTLFHWLNEYVERARFLIERWHQSKTLTTLDAEEIKRALEKQKENDSAPLSDEQRNFFELYEKQMKDESN